jgi:hypothetical protein
LIEKISLSGDADEGKTA